MIFKHLIYGDLCVSERNVDFWLLISCATLKWTLKQLFTETTKGDIKIKQFS